MTTFAPPRRFASAIRIDTSRTRAAKSCPFCGLRPTIQQNDNFCLYAYFAGCENKRCKVRPSVEGNNLSATLRAWNGRAERTDSQA